MNGILLTQNSTFIIGQVAWLLGKIMEGIFEVLNMIGIPNIGLAIILFTIVVNLLMMPLTIKQQKFSKLSAKMNPEIQAIQAKYKNRKDQDAQLAQNQEIQAVYAKYGVSPTGSCLYMLIQMPILFALYRVIYAIPAYVGRVKEAFFPLVDNIIDTAGATELVQNLSNSAMYSKQFTNSGFVAGTHSEYVQNTIIDCLNKASTADFASISEKFPSLAADVTNTVSKLEEYNNFLGLNIGNSPSYVLKEAWANGAWLLVIGAIAIPVLSALTQWINVKLMPQQDTSSNNGNDQAAAMASSMKTMNMIMPLMSAWFCFTLPSGLGLYWVAGSVVRSIQQIVINKHIDKMDFDDIIRKNSAKSAKKLEKMNLITLVSFRGNHGSMIYLNNYLSIMFNISDVLIDKEEIAMKMKLPIYIPKETPAEETEEPETVCVPETVTDEQITVSKPIPCVPISHIRYMVKKVANLLDTQGISCCHCPRTRYILSPLSDCKDSIPVIGLNIICPFGAANYRFELTIEPRPESAKLEPEKKGGQQSRTVLANPALPKEGRIGQRAKRMHRMEPPEILLPDLSPANTG